MPRRNKTAIGSLEPATNADVTTAILPDSVPMNEDGTPKLDGTVPEEQARDIGALDIASAAKNRAAATVAKGKLGGL